MIYFFLFIASCGLAWLATALIRAYACGYNITDTPGEARKIHTRPIPLLGGVGIYLSITLILGAYVFFAPLAWPALTDAHVLPKHLLGILVAGLFLVIGGAFDDMFRFKPYQQVMWPIAAALTVIASGIGVEKITNPFGGYIILTDILSDLLTFFWLLTMMYTTKFLDGLDGLVSGMTVINAMIIALLSAFFFVNIPTALLATIVAGSFFGFLFWNFNPAKIFLGEAGSTLAGFFLGILAIISGAKVATTLLILGIPVFDGVWVIFRRIVIEKRSPFQGDKKHIHFRLLDAGLSQRQAVFLLYGVAATCGILALFLQSSQKMYALISVGIGMVILAVLLIRREKRS